MQLNFREHSNYTEDIIPFLRNGIIIDTSVMKEYIDGLINIQFSKKPHDDFQKILLVLEKIKMDGKWNEFLITPHIFTETCKHFWNDHNHRRDFEKICRVVLPILNEMTDKPVGKKEIIDVLNDTGAEIPRVEVGDISIKVVADDYVSNGKKVAVFSKDSDINDEYRTNDKVMIIDYDYIYNNAI